MRTNNLYVRSDNGKVVTAQSRDAIMAFLKLAFRLNIINEDQVLNIATKFQILFV